MKYWNDEFTKKIYDIPTTSFDFVYHCTKNVHYSLSHIVMHIAHKHYRQKIYKKYIPNVEAKHVTELTILW